MTDPQTAADAAERVQAAEAATWLRARLQAMDETIAATKHVPDDECPPTHFSIPVRLRPLPDGRVGMYGPEIETTPDRLRALLDERDALLADRERMAAELEQVRGDVDEFRARRDNAVVQGDASEAETRELAQALITAHAKNKRLLDRATAAETELERVRRERAVDAERIEYATDLLSALVRTSPCLQEKGGCITHDRYLPEGSDCPHGLARAFLAGAKAHRSAETTATRPAGGKRTPEQWCAEYGIDIADPDGWRGRNDPPWDEPITLPDFLRRAAVSTTRGLTPDLWNRLSREAHEAADAERSDAEGAGKGPESP